MQESSHKNCNCTTLWSFQSLYLSHSSCHIVLKKLDPLYIEPRSPSSCEYDVREAGILPPSWLCLRDVTAGLMGGTKTPSWDEQAEGRTPAYSLEHSERFEGTVTLFLPLTRQRGRKASQQGDKLQGSLKFNLENLKLWLSTIELEKESFLIRCQHSSWTHSL